MRWRLVLAAVLVASAGAVGWESGAAGAQDGPCAAVDRASVGRLLGPTAEPEAASANGQPVCRVTVGGSLDLTVMTTTGGAARYDELAGAATGGDRESVDDYVDSAAFAWGGGEVRFVARRGDEVVVLALVGTDPGNDFDSEDPLASAPGGTMSGSPVGSALWALMTEVLARTDGTTSPPSADDLTGLWRTTDVTPCPPLRDLSVRVSRWTDDDGALRAEKVAGDACLEDGAVDFEGAVSGSSGQGTSFGGTGSTTQDGTPYELTVRSPTQVRLTGEAGTLRYTLDYERLSWPGLFEPGTAHDSALLGIPSPAESVTPKNVALSGAVSGVLLLLVVLPTSLFNSALEANLERYRAAIARWSRRPGDGADRTASPWTSPAGLAGYLVLAGAIYSLVQPGWGWNAATLITLIGFIGAAAVTSAIAVVAAVVYLGFRYREGRGAPTVTPWTLAIAVLCVLASRLVGFLPGYMYGVVVGWDPRHQRDEFDRGRILAFASTLALVLALVSWLLIPVCRDLAGDGAVIPSLPLAIVSGVFVGCTESVTIGLLPVRMLPGDELRRHSERIWRLLWGGGGFLFVLVLLKPGVVTGSSRNAIGTLVLVAVASAAALAFWALQRPSGAGSPPSPAAEIRGGRG